MSSLRILMYCHDRSGLSHTMRTMMMASHLVEKLPDCSILLLTDLSIIGRFKFPENVDYVHLPGFAGRQNSYQFRGKLNIELDETFAIRRKITKSTVKTFQPDFFIIDRDPYGLQEEMHRLLSFVRDHLPKTKLIWGLSDVIGDPGIISRDWNRENFYHVLEQYCDEVWIYGAQEIFDQIRSYQIPAAVAKKCYYTGYLRPPRAAAPRVHKDVIGLKQNKKPYVLITTGGGAEGFTLIDNYLRVLECNSGTAPFQSLIVTGPMMPTRDKFLLKERADRLPGVILHRFSKHVLQYVKHAHLVVSTGGYNALCEVLSFRKKTVLAPPLAPPNEHLLRADIFQDLGVIKRLPPRELSAERLSEMVQSSLFDAPEMPVHPIDARIPLDGLDRIVERIEILGDLKSRVLRQAV